jgi:hypothetical protein
VGNFLISLGFCFLIFIITDTLWAWLFRELSKIIYSLANEYYWSQTLRHWVELKEQIWCREGGREKPGLSGCTLMEGSRTVFWSGNRNLPDRSVLGICKTLAITQYTAFGRNDFLRACQLYCRWSTNGNKCSRVSSSKHCALYSIASLITAACSSGTRTCNLQMKTLKLWAARHISNVWQLWVTIIIRWYW